MIINVGGGGGGGGGGGEDGDHRFPTGITPQARMGWLPAHQPPKLEVGMA